LEKSEISYGRLSDKEEPEFDRDAVCISSKYLYFLFSLATVHIKNVMFATDNYAI